MSWKPVGSVAVGPLSEEAIVGPVNLPPMGGIVLRVRQTSGRSPWPYSFGLVYVRNSQGRELGTIKVFGTLEGECYRLGEGLPSVVGAGMLYFSPRLYNRAWLKHAAEPWSLSFEYDDPDVNLPQDRHQAPGFVGVGGALLDLVSVGSLGRVRF